MEMVIDLTNTNFEVDDKVKVAFSEIEKEVIQLLWC